MNFNVLSFKRLILMTGLLLLMSCMDTMDTGMTEPDTNTGPVLSDFIEIKTQDDDNEIVDPSLGNDISDFFGISHLWSHRIKVAIKRDIISFTLSSSDDTVVFDLIHSVFFDISDPRNSMIRKDQEVFIYRVASMDALDEQTSFTITKAEIEFIDDDGNRMTEEITINESINFETFDGTI